MFKVNWKANGIRFEVEEAKKDLAEELEKVNENISSFEETIATLRAANTELEVLTKQQTKQLDTLQSELKALESSGPTPRESVRMSIRPGVGTIPAPPALAPGAPPPPAPAPALTKMASPAPANRANMFDQIRGGASLKKVEQTVDDKEDLSKHYDDQNVLHILARALIARRQGVEGDKNTTANEDDGDWE